MAGRHRLPPRRRWLAPTVLLLASLGFVGYLGLDGNRGVLEVVPPDPPVPPTTTFTPTTPPAPSPAPTRQPSSTPPPPAPTTRKPPPVPPRPPPPPPKPAPKTAPAPKPPVVKACPSSGFGGVLPHVAAVSHHVAQRFGLPLLRVLGVGNRPQNPTSDHPAGRATDFLVYGDRSLGNRIAAYLTQNSDRFAITYVIYYDRIWLPGSGWRPYSGYSPHRDHVHASFRSSPPASLPTC